MLYGTLLNYWLLVPLCILLAWVPGGDGGVDLRRQRPHEFGSPRTPRPTFFARLCTLHVAATVAFGLIFGVAQHRHRHDPRRGGRQEEVPFNFISGGTILGLMLLFFAAKLSGGDDVGWGLALLVTLAGGLWLGLASLVVAQTTGRTDWSPLSGLALIAIAIMMGIMGTDDKYIVPAVTIGAAICVATSMCADMMADLKTGYLVGGRPLKQQVAQIATCWIGPGISLATVVLLWNAYGFGPDQASILYERAVTEGPQAVAAYTASGGSATQLAAGVPELGAPQAGALQAAIQIVQDGNIPLGKYLTGAVLGVVVSLAVSPGIGVMVGLSLYLPFEYMIVFGLGGVINILIRRFKGARFAEDKGVPIAAGLIVGDALVGIVNAVTKVVQSV